MQQCFSWQCSEKCYEKQNVQPWNETAVVRLAAGQHLPELRTNCWVQLLWVHDGPPTNHQHAFTFCRDLSAAEGGIGAASSKVERMELEIESLQQEADVLNEQKKSLCGEMAAVQKDLQGKDETAVSKL